MPLTILIIENFNFLRLALRRQVEVLFPEARVVEAGDQTEGLAMIQTNSPQMIVMDIGLSGADSLRGIRYFKAIVPLAVVVVLTSYKDELHWADASAAGADACILKAAIRTELPLILTRLLQIQVTCY